MSPLIDDRGNARGRVLVVDDTADVRFMVTLQLATPGVTFEEAAAGEEALARCESESFDVIVLDYRMPGLTGVDVARKLREQDYPGSIVIYSAYVDQALEAEASMLELPVVDKTDRERLREVVQEAMALVGSDMAR
jgi:CheY-like chemotaxis protein